MAVMDIYQYAEVRLITLSGIWDTWVETEEAEQQWELF